MTRRVLAVVVACTALGPTGLACSSEGSLGGAAGSSGLAGEGGAGGAAGASGAGGEAGAGGSGSADGSADVSPDASAESSAPLTLPSCLQELFAACPETGACQVERNDAGVIQSICYASGVRSSYAMGSGGCTPTELRIYKPDGSLCYIEQSEPTIPVRCEGSFYTWRDAAGTVVATGDTSISFGLRVECSATGEKLQCNGNTCPPGLWGMRYACQPGTCP